jgi:hypothetical protein
VLVHIEQVSTTFVPPRVCFKIQEFVIEIPIGAQNTRSKESAVVIRRWKALAKTQPYSPTGAANRRAFDEHGHPGDDGSPGYDNEGSSRYQNAYGNAQNLPPSSPKAEGPSDHDALEPIDKLAATSDYQIQIQRIQVIQSHISECQSHTN